MKKEWTYDATKKKNAWSIGVVMWSYLKWIIIPIWLILCANIGALIGKGLFMLMTYLGVEDNFIRFIDWLTWL